MTATITEVVSVVLTRIGGILPRFKHVYYITHFPKSLSDICGHRRRDAKCFMDAHEIVIHREQQMATIRNMVMAWVLTLPAAILLSGTLYVIFSRVF